MQLNNKPKQGIDTDPLDIWVYCRENDVIIIVLTPDYKGRWQGEFSYD